MKFHNWIGIIYNGDSLLLRSHRLYHMQQHVPSPTEPSKESLCIIDDIHKFWFGEQDVWSDDYEQRPHIWFSNPNQIEFDQLIKDKYEEWVVKAVRGDLSEWESTPKGCLALVLLMDQFTRNVYRGDARMFDGDSHSIKITERCIADGTDLKLSPIERLFLYMPMKHQEDVVKVRACVDLLDKIRETVPPQQRKHWDMWCDMGVKHIEMLTKFGRYPYR